MKETINYFLYKALNDITCCCPRARKGIKKRMSGKDRIMDKAIRKMERDLDISKLLTVQRGIKENKAVLFDRNDNTLMRLQQDQVVSSDDSTS